MQAYEFMCQLGHCAPWSLPHYAISCWINQRHFNTIDDETYLWFQIGCDYDMSIGKDCRNFPQLNVADQKEERKSSTIENIRFQIGTQSNRNHEQQWFHIGINEYKYGGEEKNCGYSFQLNDKLHSW